MVRAVAQIMKPRAGKLNQLRRWNRIPSALLG